LVINPKYIKKMKYKLSILLAVLVLVSCKTTQTISKKTTTEVNPVIQVIEQVQKVQPQFRTANISKLSLELQMKERTFNVSATCKIKKDSAMFISIQPFLGMEMFKAELMPDSMRVFDKMNRRFYVVDYSTFSKRFGVDVDFYSIQSLLSGQFFCIGKKTIQTDSCKLQTQNGKNSIEFGSSNMVQTTNLSATNTIEQVLLKKRNSHYQLLTNFSDYAVVSGINFPQKIDMTASGENTKAACNFSILKVEFNTDIKLQGISSDRFTRSNIDDLLKK